MTHPKPDNAPTPTDPVLGAEQIAKDLIATWLSPFYSHGGIKDGIVLAINNERALLAQRDKRVDQLEKALRESIVKMVAFEASCLLSSRHHGSGLTALKIRAAIDPILAILRDAVMKESPNK